MTSPILWWGERLEDQYPVSPVFNIIPYNVKPVEGAVVQRWPGRVARQALLEDYTAWVEAHNKRAWPGVEPGDKRLVKPLNELHFFTILAPYLYVNGKARMVKTFLVPRTVPFEGSFQTIKVRRYFIRLGTWEEHMAAYKRETGLLRNAVVPQENRETT